MMLLLSLVAPFAAFADSFYVSPVNVIEGETAKLEFCLDNSQDFYGFQADVTLPTGLTTVKNDGDPVVTLSSRAAAAGNYQVTSNVYNGVVKMAVFSGNKTAFTGTSGVLVSLEVNVGKTFVGGDVKVSNIIFTDKDNKDVKLSDTSAKIGFAVSEVTFERTKYAMTVGGTTTFVATIHPDDAVATTLTWASSDPTVASVDDKGNVVALKVGTTNITATSENGKVATCALTVNAVAVTSVSLDKTKLNLTEGDKATLTASVLPEKATNKTLTWSSDHKEVAIVSSNGEVAAVGEGTAIITVSSANGKEATCTVKVAKKLIPVTSINISQATAELKVNGTVTLTATVLPENTTDDKKVTWSSSDEAIATVDANGKVTAKAIGEATITATCGSVTATCAVTVIATPVESISFTRKQLTMKEGETTTLTPNFNPTTATDKSVTWKSSDEAVATVSASGEVSAIKEGSAIITATSSNGKSATIPVTVSATIIPVTSISIDKTALSLTAGDNATLTATIAPADATDPSVEWSSSDETVATVSKNGEVTALAEGTATITAESSNGKTAKCTVTVAAKIIEAESITLSNETAELKVGGTLALTAVVAPENTSDKTVTWTSSDEAVATVDANGKVTAKAIGEATITATCGSVKAECAVKVVATPVESIELNLTELTLTEGDKSTLKVTYTPGSATDKTVTWTSSDESVATVAATGEVTAVKAGTASITATTANGKTASCTVTVEAKEVPVTSITLSETEVELMVGKTASLTATVNPKDATDSSVEWTSSNTKVATVSREGVITAKAVGTAVITAAGANDKSATCTVKVIPVPVEGLAIQDEEGNVLDNTHSLALHVGDEYTLTEVVSPENATEQKVTWTSSDEAVAKIVDIVEEPHQVHIDAIGLGKATITASLAGFSTSFEVNVAAPEVAITGIKLDKATAEMETGATLQLNATIAPENATSKEVKWTSSDYETATVDQKGVVTAKKAGKVTITATANYFTATCVITIKDPVVAVTGVTLDKTEATLEVGEAVKLTATVAPENAADKTVTWTSSDAAVATVDAEGNVTAIAAGVATITAKAGEATATCKVTVKSAQTVETGVILSQTFTADTTLENTAAYTWGADIQSMITANGLYLTNAGNKANNYENRDFLTFANPVGDATNELNISYEVYNAKDKGQANTYYTINYFNADDEFVFAIQEASGNWGYTANVITANEDGSTTTVALAKGHMAKGGGSVVDVTVKFGGSSAIVMIDGGSYLAYTAKQGIKSVKLSVSGENGYDRDMYIKNYELKVTECEAVEFATYTLKYVVGSEVIKEVENSGIAGLAPSLTAAETEDFVENGKKYIYVSNDAEGQTIASDGSTVVTVTYREAAEYTYTVKNNVNDEVITGTCFEGNSATVPYHRYILDNGTVYMKDAIDKQYNYTFTPDADDFEVTLDYTEKATDGIYFIEAENMAGMTAVTNNNADVRCSNAAGAYPTEAGAVKVITLAPGKYKVEIAFMGGKQGDTDPTFFVKAGETTVLEGTTNGSWTNPVSEEFELTSVTVITVEGGSANRPLDYVLITGTKSEEVAAESISLDVKEAEMKVGEKLTITATVTPENASEIVEWSSSDDAVATVDEFGVVTAVGNGNVTITAKVGEFVATCEINVNGESTGVDGIDADENDVWYTLNGVRISRPNSTGIFIKNGKKVVIR